MTKGNGLVHHTCILAAALAGAACGGAGGPGGDDTGDDVIDVEPQLFDQIGCHMLPDLNPVAAIPPHEGTTRVCLNFDMGQPCLARNTRFDTCLGEDTIWFEWEPGDWFNVKMRGWYAETSTHGEVTTQTNADSGIIGVPPSTRVTATASRGRDGSVWTVIFRMTDDYVVFERVDPPGGW